MRNIATGKSKSMPTALLVGVGTSIGITLTGILILTKMLELEKMKWESVGYGILFVILIASFLGSIITITLVKHQIILMGISAGAAYFSALMLATALFFGGKYEAVSVTALLILAGSGSSILMSIDRGVKRKGKKIRGIKNSYR